MSWQLTLASCAAANLRPGFPPSPDPLDPVIVEWDATKLQANHALSNGNLDVENTGANNIQVTAFASKPILPAAGRVYFEFEIVTLGASTNTHSVGLMSDLTSIMGQSPINTNKNPGMAYFSDGKLFSAATQVATGLATLPAGTIIGMVVNAASGKVWIYRNNVLQGVGASLVTGVPTCWIRAGQAYFPACVVRDNTDKVRLLSIASQFHYTAPVGTTPYGNDNLDFNEHYLIFENGAMAVLDYYAGGYSLDRWTIDANGSTSYTKFGASDSTTLFTPTIWNNGNTLNKTAPEGSHPSFTAFPSQSGKTWGVIYQEFALDSRFEPLIDNGEYALRVRASIGMLNVLDIVNYNASFVAYFLDETDTLISTSETDKLCNDTLSIEYTRFISVPPLTRKIRVGFKQYKQSGDTTNDNLAGRVRMFNRQASLIRKLPMAKVRTVNGAMVLLGRPTDEISMNKARTFVIITPE